MRRPGARNAKTAAQVPQLFFMVHDLLFPLLKGLLQGCHATDLLCNTYCGLHALRGLQPGGRRGRHGVFWRMRALYAFLNVHLKSKLLILRKCNCCRYNLLFACQLWQFCAWWMAKRTARPLAHLRFPAVSRSAAAK